jgi:hypothetical protein
MLAVGTWKFRCWISESGSGSDAGSRRPVRIQEDMIEAKITEAKCQLIIRAVFAEPWHTYRANLGRLCKINPNQDSNLTDEATTSGAKPISND